MLGRQLPPVRLILTLTAARPRPCTPTPFGTPIRTCTARFAPRDLDFEAVAPPRGVETDPRKSGVHSSSDPESSLYPVCMASSSTVSTVASCASPTNASVVTVGDLRRFAAAAASASTCACSSARSFASTEAPIASRLHCSSRRVHCRHRWLRHEHRARTHVQKLRHGDHRTAAARHALRP